MTNSDEECDIIRPGTVTPKKLPKQGGGGGHEFVTTLPLAEDASEGVEYVLMDDLSDPSTYKGTYILNPDTNSFVSSSSGGGGWAVDASLSTTSTNPVQNKVLTTALESKADDADIPDVSGFATKSELTTGLEGKADKSTTYTKTEVNTYVDGKITEELARFDHLDYKIVNTLPAVGEAGVRYLVKHPTDNSFEEFIYVDGDWADIGATDAVDLSNYYDKAQTDALLDDKQDTLTAGENITIENGVISATYAGNAYELCNKDVGGNVIQIGTIKINGATYGIYEFYYQTAALPDTTTADYSVANLLADYSINDFIDATGITNNGIFIGNGRTDNNNRLIVQQFSKNNKTITIRTYQDFSNYYATLKVQFIGTKN